MRATRSTVNCRSSTSSCIPQMYHTRTPFFSSPGQARALRAFHLAYKRHTACVCFAFLWRNVKTAQKYAQPEREKENAHGWQRVCVCDWILFGILILLPILSCLLPFPTIQRSVDTLSTLIANANPVCLFCFLSYIVDTYTHIECLSYKAQYVSTLHAYIRRDVKINHQWIFSYM